MDDLCSAKKMRLGGLPGRSFPGTCPASRAGQFLRCGNAAPGTEEAVSASCRRFRRKQKTSSPPRGPAFPEKGGGRSPMQAIPARGRPAPGRPWQGARHKAPNLTRGRRAFACKSPPFPESGSRRRPQGYAKAEPGAGYRRFCLWPPCCRERRAGIRPRHGVSPADAEGAPCSRRRCPHAVARLRAAKNPGADSFTRRRL